MAPAGAEAQPSAADLVARVGVQQAVVEAVLELDDIHRELTEARGPSAADRACRLFRAAWRNMMRFHESLPDSPAFGITWNGHREERRPIAWGDFPSFWTAIEAGVKTPSARISFASSS